VSYGAQLASETAVISNLWPALPPRNTTRNRSTIIRFDGRWCKEITPLGVILSLIPRTLSLHLAIVLPGAAVGFVLRLHAL